MLFGCGRAGEVLRARDVGGGSRRRAGGGGGAGGNVGILLFYYFRRIQIPSNSLNAYKAAFDEQQLS